MPTDTMVLKTLLGTYGNTKAIKDRTVAVPGVTLDFADITPVFKAFRQMIGRTDFDVSEMAVTTFMVAKSFDKPLTGLPIVVFRKFHHRTIQCNVASGIRVPKDLEGKRVAIRAFAQTGPTWSRGILQHEYGVDVEKVNWVTFEGSHVVEYQDPEHVTRAPEGKRMEDMLVAGEVDAAIFTRPIDSPSVRPLIADGLEAETEWYRKTGIYPVNHMMVVKSDLAGSHPWILRGLLEAFETAKRLYLDQLDAEGTSTEEDKETLELKSIVGDPYPHGVGPNRKAFEALAQYAFEQKLLPRPYSLEDLFGASVLALG